MNSTLLLGHRLRFTSCTPIPRGRKETSTGPLDHRSDTRCAVAPEARAALLACFMLLPSAPVLANAHPPAILVDKGACPFECCTYGQWTTIEKAPLFQEPSERAARIGTIAPGTHVFALTGQVQTVGQRFIVHRSHLSYKPGDVLTVYTYYGEGAFSVWFAGKRYTENLGFSPYGGTGGSRCSDSKYCWGELQGELKSQWWAQVRLPDGRVGWVKAADGFEGADRCG